MNLIYIIILPSVQYMSVFSVVCMPIVHLEEPVYKDHTKGPGKVASKDRWSLYRGAFLFIKDTLGPANLSTVGFWSLCVYRGSLYNSVHCTTSICKQLV